MKKELVLAVALAASPFAASAATLDYTYLEAGFARQQAHDLPAMRWSMAAYVEPGDLDADGFFVGGSFAVSESFYVFADYRRGEGTLDATVVIPLAPDAWQTIREDGTLSRLAGGLGFRHAVADSTDLLAEASALNSRVDFDGALDSGDRDGTALRASVGVRSAPTEFLELWAKVHYTDGDMYDSAGSVSAGVQYRLTQVWGLVAEGEAGGDFPQLTAGVRASF